MSERWKKPVDDQGLRSNFWAEYLEQHTSSSKSSNSNSNPMNTSNESEFPKKVPESAIDDLQLNGLLHMSSKVNNHRDVDSFVESVMYSIDIEQDLAGTAETNADSEDTSNSRRFVMLDRLHPNGQFLSEDDEYEIPEHLTSAPVTPDKGKRLFQANGHQKNGNGRNGNGTVKQSRLVVRPPSSRQDQQKPNQEPAIQLAASKSVAAAPRRGINHRVLAAIAAAILFSLGITLGYFLSGVGSSPRITEDTPPKRDHLDSSDSKAAKGSGEPNELIAKDRNQKDGQLIDRDQLPDKNPDGIVPDAIHQKKSSVAQTDPPKKDRSPNKEPGKEIDDSKSKASQVVQSKGDRVDPDDPFSIDPKSYHQRDTSWLATIKSGLDQTEWKETPGRVLGQEMLELKKGQVKIEMKNGAMLTIEAPARFQMINHRALDLHSGTIAATVPERAIGFSIQTPSTKVVDLGTEFKVTVDEKQVSRVSVSKGLVEVETRRKDGENRKWQQKAGQSSVISKEGNAVEWLLSFQFDRHGFGVIEFNGKTLEDVLMSENAEFTLRNIIRSVTPPVRAAEPYLESPLRGAIVVGKETFIFENAREISQAYNAASRSIRNHKVKELSLNELMAAKKRFVARHEAFMKQLQETIENQTGHMNLNAQAQSTQLRFPTANSAIGFASSGQKDIAKMITDQTMAILEAKPRKNRSRRARNKVGSRKPTTPERLFTQMVEIGDFGKFRVGGLLDGAEQKPIPTDLPTIQKVDEATLRKQLNENVSAVNLFQSDPEAVKAIQYVEQLASKQAEIDKRNPNPMPEVLIEPLRDFIKRRTHLNGLPITMGKDCRLEKTKAESLGSVSNYLGRTLSTFNRFGSLPSFQDQQTTFRDGMVTRVIDRCSSRFGHEESVSGLVQMLQADRPRVRYQLIKSLEQAESREAAIALAQRAKYDLDPEVRLAATESLKKYPFEQYRETLLEGLNYPWPVVAQHSAEALARIGNPQVVDDLVNRLEQPNPLLPYKDENGKAVIREVVAINHMRNCLLCHAPSVRTSDSVRGNIPSPGQPLPQQYYQTRRGSFIRADVTYLKQDFSVVQPVEATQFWPAKQRFDYVVRNRLLTPNEETQIAANVDPKTGKVYHEAVVFALRQLTGKRPDRNNRDQWAQQVAEWKKEQSPKPKEPAGNP